MRNQTTANSTRSTLKSGHASDISNITMEMNHNSNAENSPGFSSDSVLPRNADATNVPASDSMSSKNTIILKRMSAEDCTEEADNEEKVIKPSMIKESVLNIDYSSKEKGYNTDVLKESKKKNVSDKQPNSSEWKKQNNNTLSSKYSKDARGKEDEEDQFFDKEQLSSNIMNVSKSNLDTVESDIHPPRVQTPAADLSTISETKKHSGLNSSDNRHLSTFADFRSSSILDFSAKPSQQKSTRRTLTLDNNPDFANDENEDIAHTESKFLKSKSRNKLNNKSHLDSQSQVKPAQSSISNLQHHEDSVMPGKMKTAGGNNNNTNTFTVSVDAHSFVGNPSSGHVGYGGQGKGSNSYSSSKLNNNVQVERKKVIVPYVKVKCNLPCKHL